MSYFALFLQKKKDEAKETHWWDSMKGFSQLSFCQINQDYCSLFVAYIIFSCHPIFVLLPSLLIILSSHILKITSLILNFVKWINILMTYKDTFCKMVKHYNDVWRSWKWPLLTFHQTPHMPENEFESTFVFFIFSKETILIFSVSGQKRAILYKYLVFSDIFLHLNLNGIHL